MCKDESGKISAQDILILTFEGKRNFDGIFNITVKIFQKNSFNVYSAIIFFWQNMLPFQREPAFCVQ